MSRSKISEVDGRRIICCLAFVQNVCAEIVGRREFLEKRKQVSFE
jgi:hypothetical protein